MKRAEVLLDLHNDDGLGLLKSGSMEMFEGLWLNRRVKGSKCVSIRM